MNEVLGEMQTDYPTDRDKALIKHFFRTLSGPAGRTNGRRERDDCQLPAILFDARCHRGVWRRQEQLRLQEIDRGKIVCVAMPQKFQMERRYVNTFLKMLFYTHALRRFDRPKEEQPPTIC